MEVDATEEEEPAMTAGPGLVRELISAMDEGMRTMQKDIKALKGPSPKVQDNQGQGGRGSQGW